MKERQIVNIYSVAPLSLVFMALSVLYYFYYSLQGEGQDWSEVLMHYGGSLREGIWAGDIRRFILPMFMHGGLLHLFLNMYFLFQIGPSCEVHYGSSNFAAIYLLSGVGCVCLSQLFGGNLSVGASGCLFGMLGAHLSVQVVACHDLRRAFKNSDVRRTAFNILINFVICGLIPNVDNWGHLGGLLLGFMFGFLFEYWRKHRYVGVAMLSVWILIPVLLVASCRWSFFNPHYHAFQGLLADREGNQVQADLSFQEAREWAKVWTSTRGGMLLWSAAREAFERGDLARGAVYQNLAVEISGLNGRALNSSTNFGQYPYLPQ